MTTYFSKVSKATHFETVYVGCCADFWLSWVFYYEMKYNWLKIYLGLTSLDLLLLNTIDRFSLLSCLEFKKHQKTIADDRIVLNSRYSLLGHIIEISKCNIGDKDGCKLGIER